MLPSLPLGQAVMHWLPWLQGRRWQPAVYTSEQKFESWSQLAGLVSFCRTPKCKAVRLAYPFKFVGCGSRKAAPLVRTKHA